MAINQQSEKTRLIPDWETDLIFVAFPQYMSYYRKLRPFFNDLLATMVKYDKVVCFVDDSNYKPVPGVHYVYQPDIDIWIRDFAPFVTNRKLYQYKYEPTYFPAVQSLKINQAFANTTSDWPVEKINIITDGGNFIHNGHTLIMTDKIYHINPHLNKEQIDNIFYGMGAHNIVNIPQHPYDVTGHADGMVKWIDENQLFITRFEDDKKFQESLVSAIKSSLPNTQIYELPFFFMDSNFENWEDANGIYINYLQTKNAVYVPIFGRDQDQEIIDLMKSLFKKPIEFIRTDLLSKYGGLINCATWNASSDLLEDWLKKNIPNGIDQNLL